MVKRVLGMILCLLLCAAQPARSHAEDAAALYQGYTLSRLSIRAKPSTDAPALDYYDVGDTVLILGYEPTWLKVQKNDVTGYVLRHLVKVDEQLTEGSLRYGALPARHAASLLHNSPLYESPDAASATVANLPEGARIAILSIQDGWAKLIYNRQYAYLHVSHLVNLEPVAKDAKTARDGALLAAYYTPYGTASTELNLGRMVNIETACIYMQGEIIEPGQRVSYNKWIGPFNAKRGFQQAPVLINGITMPGSGGGTCQVSTTLYNAMVSLSGISFPYVRAHGASGAAYVPHGMDAAVGAERIDLVFQNDYDFPVRIFTWAGQGVVYTALYKVIN